MAPRRDHDNKQRALELAAKRLLAVLGQVAQVLLQAAPIARKIDWRTAIDGRVHAHLIKTIVAEELERLDEKGRERLRKDHAELDAYFQEIIQSNVVCNKQTVLRAIVRAMLVGMQCSPLPERLEQLQTVLKKAHAANMRKAKEELHEDFEQALLDAIIAERGKSPCPHPWKQTNTILAGVNTRLKTAGHKTVGPYVVYRRLKKFLRS